MTTVTHFMVLSNGQFNAVYNALSFVFAAMLASFVFFLLIRPRISQKNQAALILTTLVVLIAGYHYLRIFNSWNESFHYAALRGDYIQSGPPFNEAYRYVDWLLTVPLLLAELVLVLRLKWEESRSLIIRLGVASLFMIGLGYPGELAASDSTARLVGVVCQRCSSSTSFTCSLLSSLAPLATSPLGSRAWLGRCVGSCW